MPQMKGVYDELLSNASSLFVPEGYIAEEILPFIGSKQSTGKLAKYGNSHLRIESSLVGGRGEYRRVEAITKTTQNFNITGHGLEGLVTEEDYRNSSTPYRPEEDETMGITTMLWLEKEKALADTLQSTAVLTQNTTLVGGAQLNNYATSDPIGVFGAARSAIRAGSGATPTMAIMDWQVWNKIRYSTPLINSLGFTYARPGGLREDEMASVMGVDKVVVAKAVYNAAKENQPDNIIPIWGKDIIFAVLPDRAIPYQTSLAYIVGYEGEKPRKVYKENVFNPPEATKVLVKDAYEMLVSNVGAGYLIKNAIA